MTLPNKIFIHQLGSASRTGGVALWPYLWAASLSLVWLLPVGAAPWSTYAADLWMAIVALSGGAAVLLIARTAVPWHATTMGCAFLALVPWLQWGAGLLPYFGQAWVASLYISGFCLAILVGTAWEKVYPAQLAGLFLGAVLLAAIVSVGLQLYAWSGLSDTGALGPLFSGVMSARPSAALGQPNQLATFLLWGMIANLYFFSKKTIGGRGALVVAGFLLLGLALTQSRTGVLSAVCLWAWICFRRKFWDSSSLAWFATVLLLYFLICPYFLASVNDFLLLDQGNTLERFNQKSEVRFQAWGMLAQSALAQPWWGYGWTETSAAQIVHADKFDGLGGVFSHSHNLFLDLILWMGLPLGIATIFALVWIFMILMKNTRNAEDASLFLCLLAVGMHAMLEFPLQYAYFLLPSGLMVGVLSVRMNFKPVWKGRLWVAPCMLVALAIALGLTVRDYSSVEKSYLLLRLEQGLLGQNRPPLGGPPEVTVLSHLREWIVVSRIKPRPHMTVEELVQLEVMGQRYPSRSFAYQLASAYALNDRPQEALVWLNRICKFTDAQDCALVERAWKKAAQQDYRFAVVHWPQG